MDPEARRRALLCLALALIGLHPLWQVDDAGRRLAWLAVWAAPAGVLAGAFGGRAAWSVPLLWALGLWALGLWAVSPVAPRVGLALVSLTGLFAAGLGLGRFLNRGRSVSTWPAAAWTGAGALFLAGALFSALPALGLVSGEAPWSPGAAALWLDLSPASLVAECGGLDWMRHPAVYAPAGADSIGPELRQPFGPLAGVTVLLVGCVLAWVGELANRELRSRRQTQPED